MLCHGENRGCCFITYSDTVKELRFLAKLLHSCLTFFEGRAWMPEVERPEFRKDAKPTERSYGKCGSAFLGIALLGFAIRINALVNVDEGKNQRD